MMHLHPDVAAFAAALRELEAHLQTYGEPGWAERVARCASFVERSDYYGVERYRQLLGGMGSLNDLVLHQGGRWLTTENDELQALLARTGELVGSFRLEQRGSD